MLNRLTGRRVGARTGLSGPAGDWLELGPGGCRLGSGFVPELDDWELGTRVGRSNDPTGGASVPTCPGDVSSLRGRPLPFALAPGFGRRLVARRPAGHLIGWAGREAGTPQQHWSAQLLAGVTGGFWPRRARTHPTDIPL